MTTRRTIRVLQRGEKRGCLMGCERTFISQHLKSFSGAARRHRAGGAARLVASGKDISQLLQLSSSTVVEYASCMHKAAAPHS
ncbi:hypothetical protein BaRGS_00000133 [Batillaria attramentaria]|uniref:Uncharacterized protein n=1 Tax=Batillaria attramentaria TaxID=370345 RepID=A0ABD0MAI1_9CAEN